MIPSGGGLAPWKPTPAGDQAHTGPLHGLWAQAALSPGAGFQQSGSEEPGTRALNATHLPPQSIGLLFGLELLGGEKFESIAPHEHQAILSPGTWSQTKGT